MDDERMLILRKIEAGEISVEDGAYLINAIEGRHPQTQVNVQPDDPDLEAFVSRPTQNNGQNDRDRDGYSPSEFSKVDPGVVELHSNENHFRIEPKITPWKIYPNGEFGLNSHLQYLLTEP